MYKSSTELINNELPKEVITPLYRIFENANIIYKEVLKSDFYDSMFIDSIKGRIVTYSIQRQFDPKYLMKNFPFKVTGAKMPFKQLRVELRKDNILLTIGKSIRRDVLPSVSKYKKKYAANNWGLENQLCLDLMDNHKLSFKQEPYYGIIVFGLAEDELDFVNLVIPDHKYGTILDVIELKPKFKVLRIEDIEEDDERIIDVENIKKELLAQNFSLSGGE